MDLKFFWRCSIRSNIQFFSDVRFRQAIWSVYYDIFLFGKNRNSCQSAMDLRDPISVGEGNETFFIMVWKPLPSRRILKTLGGKPKEDKVSASGVLGLLQTV